MNAAAKTGLEIRPSGRVVGLESPRRVPNTAVACVIGRDLRMDAAKLGKYCFRQMPKRAEDLIVLAGIVAFADRAIPRKTSLTWQRLIDVTIPVLELDFWRQCSTVGALHDLLNTLTGDVWNVRFTQRTQRIAVEQQAPLHFASNTPPLVMPYSDGMDSFAVARLTTNARPDTPLIMVTTGNRPDADSDWRKERLEAKRNRFAIPFQLSQATGVRLREPSFRTRALVYGAMGAVAAQLSGAQEIVVSESGQGALGPWLAPVGNEASDLRMHPIYTQKLACFVGPVLDIDVRYVHPRLWCTKGETLNELNALGLATDWEKTRSCARDARHVTLAGRHVQCGVCAACLLRRMSLRTAQLDEMKDVYLWQDLCATSLERAASKVARATTKDDERHAICGALALSQLAELSADSYATSIAQKAFELSRAVGLNASEVKAKLSRLVNAHAREWYEFLEQQGRRSLLRHWTGGA